MLYLLITTGLCGAILMFIGDMVLYYSKDDYISDGTLNPIVNIMKNNSRARLYTGGIIGTFAAFLYCRGYYHLVLIINEPYRVFAWICFFINCLGIICGGTYHSHCSYLGLIGRYNHEKILDEIHKYLNVQKTISFSIQGLGFILLALLIALKCTIFPRWVTLFTPGILFLLFPFTKNLPKGLHMIISGGWTNLISVIYYMVLLMIL